MSEIAPRHVGIVENGKLKMMNPTMLAKHIATFRGAVEVSIHKPRKHRSNPQLRYYFAVPVKMIRDEMGMGASARETEAVHHYLLDMFAFDIIEKNGVLIKVRRSTGDFSTVEMEEYLRQVRQWAAAFLSLNIPEPNAVVYD